MIFSMMSSKARVVCRTYFKILVFSRVRVSCTPEYIFAPRLQTFNRMERKCQRTLLFSIGSKKNTQFWLMRGLFVCHRDGMLDRDFKTELYSVLLNKSEWQNETMIPPQFQDNYRQWKETRRSSLTTGLVLVSAFCWCFMANFVDLFIVFPTAPL